jgi:hypothetical protein
VTKEKRMEEEILENTELDEELETAEESFDNEIEEDFEDETEETETEEAEEEELEYDDDGNVILDEKSEETETEAQEEDTNRNDPSEDEKKDDDYTKLRKQFDDREQLLKTALKAMGIDDKDVDSGLIRLAADAEGVTPEEFKKQIETARKDEEIQRVYRQVMLDRMIQADLEQLHAEFPETKGITKLEDIPNCRRFAQLRDLGLTAKEAYTAANPTARREAIASSVKQQATNASKAHLRSNVPIASKDTSVKIPRSEMEEYRELFPDMSDKDIVALYKKTKER